MVLKHHYIKLTIQFGHTVKEFKILLINTNTNSNTNSIQQFSFISTQLMVPCIAVYH